MDPNKDLNSQLLQKARNYQVPERAVEMLKKYPPLILAGVTASGKNAVKDYIIRHANYRHVITHTTRPIRGHETNGVDYWFVSEEEMSGMLDRQELMESQVIHDSAVYGTSFASFESIAITGVRPLMELDTQGINDLTASVPSLQPVFILPPSFEIWMERLGGRDNMSDGERSRRLRSARLEIEEALKNRNFVVLVNHELDETAQEIMYGVSINSVDVEASRKLGEELLEFLQTY